MTTLEPALVDFDDDSSPYIGWAAVAAGALVAAALAFVLHTFALAIGLAVTSAAPTWRDSSVALQLLSGLYLLFVAIVAFGVGGYIAGRLRTPRKGTDDEIEFRDGTQGLLVWALAIVLTLLMAWAAAQSLTRASGPTPTANSQSVAGENIIAFEVDRLFRSERRPQNIDLPYARSEAARILRTSAGHTGIVADDRAYLVRLTAANTGLAPQEAERRVETAISQARDSIRKARRSAVIIAFMAGAAALVGAGVAWFASCAGGQHRDKRSIPSMSWGLHGPRLREHTR